MSLYARFAPYLPSTYAAANPIAAAVAKTVRYFFHILQIPFLIKLNQGNTRHQAGRRRHYECLNFHILLR